MKEMVSLKRLKFAVWASAGAAIAYPLYFYLTYDRVSTLTIGFAGKVISLWVFFFVCIGIYAYKAVTQYVPQRVQ